MSADGRKFMQVVSSSVTLKDGQNHLPLPLNDQNIIMPNNYHTAKQRALHLKRKFQMDQVI